MTSASDDRPLDVFVSCASEDAPVAQLISDRLRDEGLSVWFYGNQPGGARWLRDSETALERAHACLVCLGSREPSRWFELEIELAQKVAVRNPEFRLVPVLLPGSPLRPPDGFLGLLNFLPLSDLGPGSIRAIVDSLRQRELPRPSSQTAQGLQRAAALHLAAETAAVGYKYLPALTIRRTAVQEAFERFLGTDATAIVFLGEAGVGKTSFLFDLANDYARRWPVLAFRAQALGARMYAVEEAVARVLRHYGEGLQLGSRVFQSLAEMISDQPVFLFLDAINEAHDLRAAADLIGEALQAARQTPVRICMTCRTSDWRFFEQEPRIRENLWRPPDEIPHSRGGIVLKRFSSTELEEAWLRYRDHFHLEGTLSESARQVCAHPLMLRFLCEAFAGRAVPPFVETATVFSHYWRQKVDVEPGRIEALFALVRALRQERRNDFAETQVLQLISRETFEALLSEDIIISSRVDTLTSLRRITFTYEAFLEYTLAQQILQEERWDALDAGMRLARLSHLLDAAGEERALVGAIEFIVMAHDDEVLQPDMLNLLASRGPEWRQRCCTLIPRLKSSARYGGLLERMAADESYWVRWSAAFTLAQLQPSGQVDALLHRWAQNEFWEVREAAAYSLSYLPLTAQRRALLRRLADDYYWRVRRAVARTLNVHLSAKSLQIDSLTAWANDRSWHVRDVAIISQRGLRVDPESSCRLLGLRLEDPNERIRFSVAKFAGTLPWSPESLAVLEALADDPSPWVRKRVASSAADLVGHLAQALDLLERMAGDGDTAVRWQTARSLERAAQVDRARVETILGTLQSDASPDVRGAATYSWERLQDKLPQDFETALEVLLEGPVHQIREAVARVENLLRPPGDKDNRLAALYRTWQPDYYLSLAGATRIAIERCSAVRRVELATSLLADAEEGVRWALTQTIMYTDVDKDSQARIVHSLLRDPQVWVRQAMVENLDAEVLACFAPIIDAIESLAGDEDARLREAVAKAVAGPLAHALGLRAERIQERLAADNDPIVRRVATISSEGANA